MWGTGGHTQGAHVGGMRAHLGHVETFGRHGEQGITCVGGGGGGACEAHKARM